ncbi:competence protein ComGC [Natronobacillus azotifigens]|uniref:Uncharacterized protein n=1 Tax=Natronobacillus azotifigens TaxID=472978 RepID=A0A9J6R901_9BACI|nr:hypothetical protein [Natronobacillus azotifigens]MCZ0701761.1 hypothetical protein [Natronobacillus azotifigens]
MQFLLDSMQSPVNNFLGIFLYLTLLIVLTIVVVTLLLFLIPNKLTTRIKNAIIGGITFLAVVIWFYVVILSRFR